VILQHLKKDPQNLLSTSIGKKNFGGVYPNLFRTSEKI